MYRSVLVISLVLAMPASAVAQTKAVPQQAAGDPAAAAELGERVAGRDRIRVRTPEGWMVLRQPLVHGAGIDYVAANGGGPGQLAWGEFSDVQVRKGAALTGALVGASVFALGGALVGVTGTEPCSGGFLEFDFHCGYGATEIVLLTFGGAAVGALVGAAIGAAFSKWSTVYRAEASPRIEPVVTANPAARQLAVALHLRI
jgi:hypothetical protein